MKVLITGGAGFVGSHLAEVLLDQGHEVLVLDDLSTGRISNLDHLADRPGLSYRIGSALDVPLVVELVDRADVVVHLAAAVGVRLIIERPVHTIQTNVRATEVVLDAAASKRKKVVVASTSEVYGKSSKLPFSEEDDLSFGATSRSRWAYACSKALDEWLAFAYLEEKGVPVTVVRLFNTVGPRQVGRYGMVVPNFVEKALKGEPIPVHGDGTQSRCFGHVRDVTEAIAKLMVTDDAVGKAVNVGNDREISILGLAEMVKERTGSSSEIELIPYEVAYSAGFEDLSRRVPDLTRLKGLIGYEPKRSLEDIIDDVIEDLRGRPDGD